MDVKVLYPHFFAEQQKHHVQVNTLTIVSQKRRKEVEGHSRRDGYGISTRSSLRNHLLKIKSQTMNKQTKEIATSTFKKISNQQEVTTLAPLNKSHSSFSKLSQRPPSRRVALRIELSRKTSQNHDIGAAMSCPSAISMSKTRSSSEIITSRVPSAMDKELYMNLRADVRPRSHFARKRIDHEESTRTLTRISTAPTTLYGRRTMDSSMTAFRSSSSTENLMAKLRQPEISLSSAVQWEMEANEDVDANFFLTELEAASRPSNTSVEKLKTLAKHVTLGSFMLYADPPALLAAVQHFAIALKAIKYARDTTSATLALTSLLHHHLGVALRELVVTSGYQDSKFKPTCIKYAFAAQRRALELAKQAKDSRLQARAIKALGLLLFDAHAYESALKHQQEALQLAKDENDRELEARVYANLGNLALVEHNFDRALSCHYRDLQLCSASEIDCRLGRARAHRNLSIVYAKLHQRDQQLVHENESRIAAHDGGAYVLDIINHPDTSVGNICFQSSTKIDMALAKLVTQNLAEIVRGLACFEDCHSTVDVKEMDSIRISLSQEWGAAEAELEVALEKILASNEEVEHI
ncbi:putative tetratricopeptide-like helical domain superfamily [Plasmopara halstedii]